MYIWLRMTSSNETYLCTMRSSSSTCEIFCCSWLEDFNFSVIAPSSWSSMLRCLRCCSKEFLRFLKLTASKSFVSSISDDILLIINDECASMASCKRLQAAVISTGIFSTFLLRSEISSLSRVKSCSFFTPCKVSVCSALIACLIIVSSACFFS